MKVLEGRAYRFVVQFHFRQEPGLPVACDQKIDLAFFLVAEVTEFKLAQAHVIPTLHGPWPIFSYAAGSSLTLFGDDVLDALQRRIIAESCFKSLFRRDGILQ